MRTLVAIASLLVLTATFTPLKSAAHQEEELGAAIRAFLLQHPEVVAEALNNFRLQMEERSRVDQHAARSAWIAENRASLISDGYSVIAGNPDGDLTLVEFFDYRCGFCRRAHAEVQSFLRSDSQIRYVLKEFPILGPQSLTAARASMAASNQIQGDRFLAFHEDLLMHEGTIDQEFVLELAVRHGMDTETLEIDMVDPIIDERLQQNFVAAGALHIEGTPSFVLGDSVTVGYLDQHGLAEWAKIVRRAQANSN